MEAWFDLEAQVREENQTKTWFDFRVHGARRMLEWLPIKLFLEWLFKESNKFNPGFFHNEIRERSQLETKFVPKNVHESR